MALPSDEELGTLLQSPTGFNDVAKRLQQEVTPQPKSDPYQAAYDDLNKATEQAFQDIVNTPIGGQNQMAATQELNRQAQGIRSQIDIAKEPVNAYGGKELISVFEQQQNSDFPVDAQTFQRRLQLAKIMQQSAPEKFEELMTTRAKLSAPDKDLFDRAFDSEFGKTVESAFSRQPMLMSGSEDRFDSPRQQKLWEDFWGDTTFQSDEVDPGTANEEYLRETKGDEWVDANLNPTVKLDRQLADARKAVASTFGKGVQAWYQNFATVADAITVGTTLLPRAAISEATGQDVGQPTVTGVIEMATGADRNKQAEFAGKIAEAIGDESLRPENIFLIATSLGLYASGVGAPEGAAIQGNVIRTIASRVVANAMIGGFTNAGATWARDKDQSINSLADDFVIGAFIEASLPETMAAFAAVRGTRYDRQAVIEALEGMNAKSRMIGRVGDDNLIVLDAAPNNAFVDTGINNINPNGTHQLTDDLDKAVNEAYILSVDANNNGAKLQQELIDLERKYSTQGQLRDTIKRAKLGQSSATVVGQEELVTDSMLTMARERAARAVGNAKTTARTLTSLANASEVRRLEGTTEIAIEAQRLEGGERIWYHGSGGDIKGNVRNGTFLTRDPHEAQRYAEIDAKYRTLKGEAGAKPRVYAVSLRDEQLGAVPPDAQFSASKGARVLNDEKGVPVFNEREVQGEQAALQGIAERAAASRPQTPGTAKLAARIENEITEQTRTTNTLLNDIRDPLQSPYAIRRIGHHIAASVSGRLPGSMQMIADAAINLRRSLDEITNPVIEKLAVNADKLLGREINIIKYIGPAKWEKWATKYKREVFLSRPDLFSGASFELRRSLKQAQEIGTAKVLSLEEHGYNIKALESYYFPQYWENDPKAISQAMRGRVSVAKERIYGDVIQGLEDGLIPRNMSIRDILVSHDKMLNQGFGDITMKNTMVKRNLAKAGKASISAGTYEFDSPLYKGLIGDKRIVQSVDSYYSVPPSGVNNVRKFAERVKNTSFGLFDLGVFGVQGTSAIIKGGWIGIIGELTDGMMLRAIPGAERYASEGDTLWKVLYTRNGGILGTTSAGYDFESGTLIGAIPGAQKIDRFVTEQWMDRLSKVQFDTALTPVRLSIFKGHLFLQHLMFQDIKNPKTLRAAAEAANRATLTSRGAQTAGRKGIESMLLTSAASGRAEIANITSPLRPIADLVTTGKINGPEAIAAWVGFAHLAAMYVGIQWLVNEATGQKQEYFNPMNKDDWRNFGYIKVGNKNIALIKERSIIKAMEKSFEGLQSQDPEYVAEVWSKVFVGKLSPAVSAVTSLGTGYGYDVDGFFQTGELDTKSKLLNFIPFPMALERFALNDTFRSDPVAMSLEFLGYNNYDLSVVDRRDEYARVHNPYPANDPRHADVEANGFGGMERAEAQIMRQEHPEFFTGKNNMSSEEKATFDKADHIRMNLLELENEVRADPLKRREYRDKRQALVAEMGQLFTGKKSEDKTTQDKVLTIYYDQINKLRSEQPGEAFYGDDFGTAEETAKRIIEAKYGDAGLAALDRALVVGSTALETEYRTARRSIADSGYYEIADAVVVAKSGGVWASYSDFLDSLDEIAKERNMLPQQVPAFKDMDSLISNAKEKFRERNPTVDANLVIWDGLTPRSVEAQELSAKALGRNIGLSKDVQDRMNKEEKLKRESNVDFDAIISRFR